MSYFEDYKNERYHDYNLISLVEYIASKGNSDIIADCLLLDSPDIGNYVSGYTKRDYDVHLEFVWERSMTPSSTFMSYLKKDLLHSTG